MPLPLSQRRGQLEHAQGLGSAFRLRLETLAAAFQSNKRTETEFLDRQLPRPVGYRIRGSGLARTNPDFTNNIMAKKRSPFGIELGAVVRDYKKLMAQSKHDDGSDVFSEAQIAAFRARSFAAVERTTGRNSVYFEQLNAASKGMGNECIYLARQIGVLESLHKNIRAGYLKTLEELIHGEVFSDFLEMADHLQKNGYKDAAAVVAGSTLEAHLKQLCKKEGIPADVGGKPKKADTINSELKAAKVYSAIDHKSVIGWLGTRNSAAHGDYGDYDNSQVKLLIDCVRDFISRVPA